MTDAVRPVLPVPDDLRPGIRAGTVALCHGCFDVLHFGHVNHLEAAARLADRLVVSVTDDHHVGKLGRPVFGAADRARVLSALRVVDTVVVVSEPDALAVIDALRPDIFVKGSDYLVPQRDARRAAQFRAESDLVASYGGRVVHTAEPAFSTTEVLNRVLDASRYVG